MSEQERYSNRPQWSCPEWGQPGHDHDDCEECQVGHEQFLRFAVDPTTGQTTFRYREKP